MKPLPPHAALVDGTDVPQSFVSKGLAVTAVFELVTPVTAVGTSPVFVIVTAAIVFLPVVMVIGLAGLIVAQVIEFCEFLTVMVFVVVALNVGAL